ncbi:MAG: dihydroorotate dehydrogenase [Phycisphaerales bacterium]|nr:dihydroorotate dehydrogenase [Phycisphaerales bacterium]
MCYNPAVSHPAPLATTLAGVELRNGVIAAAGTCGYVDELADAIDLSLIGAVTTKTITREPREGNAPWRMVPTPVGMLNAIGLANMGLDAFLEREVPRIRACPTTVIASVGGHSIDDYVAVAHALDETREFRALELNVSCPNTSTGRTFSSDPAALAEVLRHVRAVVEHATLFVKLPPDMADPCAMAAAAIESGAQVLVLCNTLPGMAIDVTTRAPRLSRGTGGMSGPGIHPLVVRVVHEVYSAVARSARVPIVGVGGVSTWTDAAELILAGASAIGMGTAIFADPRSALRVVRGLDRWVCAQQCTSIGELVGQVRL